MKALITVLAMLVVVGLAFSLSRSPTAPPQMTEAEIAQVEAEVLGSMETYTEGYREMDMEKVASVTHPDLLTYPYAGRLQNRTEFLETGLAWAEGRESWTISWVETNVRVLSPDLAVFSGTSVDTVTYSDGRANYLPSNAYAFLLERTPDGWKISLGGPSGGASQPVEEG